jgi:holo-[acyl-carrier protein] synthase
VPIVGHGVDVVEVARIAEMRERHADRFLERCFTPAERDYAAAGAKRTDEHLAGRFAAKEAALKAIGTGWRSGISWTDVEIVIEASGAPRLEVTGRAAEIARELGVQRWHVSISHTDRHAMASVIAESA